MKSTCRLPLNFDPAVLQTDLKQIKPTDWVRHFNANYFEGDWKGIALRSTNGSANQIYSDPQAVGEVLDTEILKRCPNIDAVLRSFHCHIQSARLLRLTPGSNIKEHRDYNLDLSEGEVRLHIPISTNSEVEFFLNGRRVEMAEGECWYLNFSLPHKVANNGDKDRIHLVVDCTLNDWLQAQLTGCDETTEEPESVVANSRGGWQEFSEFVLANPDVQVVLRQTEDRLAFIDLAVTEGAHHGFYFNAEEVEGLIRQARRSWFERWID